MRRLALLALLVSCSGGGSDAGVGPSNPPPEQPPPQQPPPEQPPPEQPPPQQPPPVAGRVAALAVVSGAEQKAEVAKELPQPVVVRVSDAKSVVVPNQLINWVVVQGGGTLFVPTTQSDAQGESRNRWTLGTAAGEQVLEARAVDPTTGEAIVFGRITATADPGPATEFGWGLEAFPDTLWNLTDPGAVYPAPGNYGRLRYLLVGQKLDLRDVVMFAKDQYGNYSYASEYYARTRNVPMVGAFEDLVVGATFWVGNEGGDPVEVPETTFTVTKPFFGFLYLWFNHHRYDSGDRLLVLDPNG
jgi:hypothetical protein